MITNDLPVPRRLVVLGAIASAVIALTGCGGSSKSSPTQTTATTTNTTPESATTSTTPSTPAPNKAADQKVAREAVLRLTDFPAGWTESDKPPETSQSPCEVVNSAKAATTARVNSHAFTKDDTPEAESSVYVYPDTATASHWFGEITTSATRLCLGDALGKQVADNARKQGATIGEVTTGSLSIEPVGDARAAARFSIPIKLKGLDVTATVDLIFARAGRGIAILPLTDTLSPFDESLAAKLTRNVVGRLETGLKQSS